LPHYRVNPTEHAEPKRQIDLKLFIVEVAYNTFVNMTIDRSPHNKIAYVFRPKQRTDLSP